MELLEHMPTGLKHIQQVGSKRLIYHHKIKKRTLFHLENNRKWCTPVINLGAIIIHNLYK